MVEAGAYFRYGYLGVHWFFIISGFVIPLSIKNQSLKGFLTARFIRLYPAYWFAVIATFATVTLFGAPRFAATVKQAIVNLSMLQSFIGVDHIDGSYWSLVIELKFYFLIGIFVVARKFLKKVGMESLATGWLVLTIIYYFYRDAAIIRAANYFLFFDFSALFIAGITFFYIFENGVTFKRVSTLVLCLVTSFLFEADTNRSLSIHYRAEFLPYISCSLLTVFFVLMFLVSIRRSEVINSSRWVQIGALTYPLYLIHQDIGYIIFNNLGEYFNRFFLFGVTTVFMIVAAYAINRKMEVPVARFLRARLNPLLDQAFARART